MKVDEVEEIDEVSEERNKIGEQKLTVIRRPDGTFVPGVSGNPFGRPRHSISLSSIMKDELSKITRGTKEVRARLLVKRIVDSAMKGEHQSQKLIMNYIEGMPRQQIDFGNADSLPFIIKIVKGDENTGEDRKIVSEAI